MAKINIPFGGTDYLIEESALDAAAAKLKSHLSTVMNGSGATINLGGVPYSVDSTKLSNATSNFVAHLGTIAGSGSKIVVGGVEYTVDSTKLDNAITEMHNALNNLETEGDGGSTSCPVHFGKKYIHSSVESNGTIYIEITFYEDGHADSKILVNGEPLSTGTSVPGYFIYEGNNIIMSKNGELAYIVSDDGTTLIGQADITKDAVFVLEDSDEDGDEVVCPIHFGKPYAAENVEIDGSTVSLTFVLNENGGFIMYANGEKVGEQGAGACIYQGTNIIITDTNEIYGTVSSDGTEINVGGMIFTLVMDCPIRFGEIYSAYNAESNKYSTLVFYENGEAAQYVNGELAMGYRLIYEGNTLIDNMLNKGEIMGIVSLDGTIIIIGDLTFSLTEPTSNLVSIPVGALYGNAITAEYYDAMPETVNEYDFFAYEDYLYVYMSSLNGWAVMLADELTIAQASQQGMNVSVPSDFVLSNRAKTSYSEILESINGIPVTIMTLTYAGCSNMVTAPTIPISIIHLEGNYEGCTSLMNITYAGNKMQWGNIFKENGWNRNVPAVYVACSNGIVNIREAFIEDTDLNEYGFYFGRKYSMVQDGVKQSMAWYPDGSIRFYLDNVLNENVDITSGLYEYGDHTATFVDTNNPLTLTFSEDGTTIISGPLNGYVLEPNIVYYGNALTGQYYTSMPETVSDYDCYLSGDYVYLYTDNVRCWVAYLADTSTLNNVQSMGLPIQCPAEFSLTNRIRSCYSDILDNINGVPVALLNLTFANCSNMVTAPTIPVSVVHLEDTYLGCTSLTNISYEGTVEQWNNVVKEATWNYGVPATQVQCSDGTVTL